jgi:hypothetical protein
MDDDRLETFRSRIGTSFHLDEVETAIELTDVTVIGDGAFSLLYHGPPDRPLVQATYTFRAADDSTEQIFIVPLGPTGDGSRMVYEAVFTTVSSP